MTKGNIALIFAAAVGVGSLPYACGYAQAKLAPEATATEFSMLESDCQTSDTIPNQLICKALLSGIQLTRN